MSEKFDFEQLTAITNEEISATNSVNRGNYKTYDERQAERQAKTKKLTAEKKPHISVFALKTYIESGMVNEYGYQVQNSIRYNVITHEVEIIESESGEAYDNLNDFIAQLHSDLAPNYTGVTMPVLSAYIDRIAHDTPYNPVQELFNSVAWDGVDRWKALFDLLHIDTSKELSVILMKKWFYQAYFIGTSDERTPIKAEGVLVFRGAQGYGKSEFVRYLTLNRSGLALYEKQLDPHNKDDLINQTATWICELGELESTLKHDIAALKSFITETWDEYRAPYKPRAEKHIRHTAFIGTCNSEDYLKDPTGNRRFWSIPLPIDKRIDHKQLEEFNFLQLWVQAKHEADTLGINCFRLSNDELTALEARNRLAMAKLPYQEELERVMDVIRATGTCEERLISVAEWKETQLKYMLRDTAVYDKLTAEKIGKILVNMGYTSERIKIKGSVRTMYELPCTRDAQRPYAN